MWCVRNPVKLGALAAIGVGLGTAGVAQDQSTELPRVQPATVMDGTIEVYGLIRQLGKHPTESGTVLAVQVTAADSKATTELRRGADGEPCPDCTATHYVLVREPGDEHPEILTRAAPGPVTYIHIDGREYMVWDVRLTWSDDGKAQLERASLAQTGFTPPPFKRKMRIRFGQPVEAAPLIDDIAWMAMRDAMARSASPSKPIEAAVQREAETRDAP